MKSKILVMVMAVTLAIVTYAFAGKGMGPGCMGQQGSINQGNCGHLLQNANLTNEQIQQLQQEQQNFWNSTAEIRQQIFDKHLELRTEFAKTEPDREKLASIQKEISDLQSQMDMKRIDHQVAMKKIAPTIGVGFMGGRGGYGMMSGQNCGGSYGMGAGCGLQQ